MLSILTTPWALTALAAIPALTALYWLRHSYRRVPVSSLMLWLDQSESRASGLRLRRLQTPILFFLELAILALLALAATGPRFEIGRGSPPLVVVLDDSLSMQAGGDKSPRSLGLAALESEIGWRSVSTVHFVLAGAQPQTLGQTMSAVEARQMLADWRCLAPQAKLAEAIAFAAELGGPTARILVVTDRKPADDPPPRVVWWAYGEARPNVAIVRAGRTTREDGERCYFEVANYSKRPRDATLVLEKAGVEIGNEKLKLAPRQTLRRTFRVVGDEAPLIGRLLESDALDLDNRAYLVRDVLPSVRVDYHIEDAGLRTLVDKALKATGKTLPPGVRPHLIVTDKQDPPEDTTSESWVVHFLQETEAEAFLGPFVLDRAHPLSEGLSLEGVIWGAGKSKDLPGVPVVMAGNVPLVTDVGLESGQHRVRIRIRPDTSTLPTAPDWPILMWNLVNWRARAMPGLERANLRLGDAAHLTVRPGVAKVILKPPSGESQELPVRDQRVAYRAVEVGVYDLAENAESTLFGVSMVNAEESDLEPCVTGRWGEWMEVSERTPGVVHLTWMLALLILVLMAAHLNLATKGFR